MKSIFILTLLFALGHGRPDVEGQKEVRRDEGDPITTTVNSAQGLEEETATETPTQKLQESENRQGGQFSPSAIAFPRPLQRRPRQRRQLKPQGKTGWLLRHATGSEKAGTNAEKITAA